MAAPMFALPPFSPFSGYPTCSVYICPLGKGLCSRSALVYHEVWPRPNTFPVWLHFHVLTLTVPPPFLRTHWDLGAHGTLFNTALSPQPGESCSLERREPDSCSSYFPPNVLSAT